MTTATTTEIELVRDFLGALERMDVPAACAMLHEDAVYQNVPLPKARGRRSIERQLALLTRYGRAFEVVWINVASNGPIVLTERTDILSVGPIDAAFWVCGTFEVRDGKIVLWRDRFDFVDFTRAFVVGAVKAVLRAARSN